MPAVTVYLPGEPRPSNLKHPRTKLWPVEDIAEVAVHSLQVADQGGKPLPSSSFPLPRVGLGT